MKTSLFIVAVAAIALAGCASAPTPEEVSKFDYGPYPAEYQKIINEYMNSRLKDPQSAQYRWDKGPSQGWDRWRGLNVGWRVCMYVNAKNSFGGYIGYQPYYFIINRDRILHVEVGDSDVGRAMVQGACASV